MFRASHSLQRWMGSIAVSLSFMAASSDLGATTVRGLELDGLVKQSWSIAQVTVGALQSFATGMPGSSPIVTRVTFNIQKVYKGPVAEVLNIDFLGGTVGTRRMSIPGMPQFKQGQRLVVFLANPADKAVSGTIGKEQGVLRIVSDPQTGTDRIYRWWGQGVNAETSFKDRTPISMETTTNSTGNAETLIQFENQLSQAIAQTQ